MGALTAVKLYTLPSRIAFAGWTQENIDNYKGPTPEVVAGLASNVRSKLGSTYCVSEVRLSRPHSPVSVLICTRAAQLARLAAPPLTECRKSYACTLCQHERPTSSRGYVALAVAGDKGTASKDLDTGCGKDRQANMVAFAVQALKLVRAFIVSEAKI